MTIQTGAFALGALPAGLPPGLHARDADHPGADPLPLTPPSIARPATLPQVPDDGHETGHETGQDADLELYLRHVERGEPIRAIAREMGCHASTVLRRIRRFEARRDDPLVDRATDRAAAAGGGTGPAGRGDSAPSGFQPGAAGSRQIARILRRLAEPGAMLVVADGMDKAIVVRDEIRTAILARELAEYIALRGWVHELGRGRVSRHALSPSGRELLRRILAARRRGAMPQGEDFALGSPVGAAEAGCAEAAAPFGHAPRQHQYGEAEIPDPEDGRRRRVRVNLSESPLLLLARRREPDGRPFLTADLVAAGERLREDFELAQIGPRVTQNWDRFLTAGVEVSRPGVVHGGGSEGARNRVALALRELGPGMGDMCLRVCCFLEGIEMTERRLGWSARSGKIVLRLALMRLERHYRETYGPGAPLIG